MAKFKVIGLHNVGGVDPGGTVDLDLPDDCIAALIQAGHIQPAPTAVKKAASEKAGD